MMHSIITSKAGSDDDLSRSGGPEDGIDSSLGFPQCHLESEHAVFMGETGARHASQITATATNRHEYDSH